MFKINTISRITHPARAQFFGLRTLVAGAALLLAMIAGNPAFGAPGEFDLSFAQGGIVRFSGDPTLPVDGQATSVIADNSGKLLVTGFDNRAKTGIFARIFANGALDTGLAGKGFIARPLEPLTSRREPTQAFPVANGGTLLIESSVGICFGSPGGCSVSGRHPLRVRTRRRHFRMSRSGQSSFVRTHHPELSRCP